ncbi:MAG TPA: alpha/beta hydrolase-fold protein [Polyangiaceae bacterium]|jgi:enterochelin esterase-like enzyme|nr:alpha/beta hydrolase-fold protein [Polyangiaceae bacterium]
MKGWPLRLRRLTKLTFVFPCVWLGACSSPSGGANSDATGGAAAIAGARDPGASGSGGATVVAGTAGTAGVSASGGSSTGGQGGDPGSGQAGSVSSGGQAAANGGRGGGAGASQAGSAGSAGSSGTTLPDPGSDGDGDSTVGPSYTNQAELGDRGNPKGKSFSFTMKIADSVIFNGKDPTVSASKVNTTRAINVYIPKLYKDGDAAPVLIIQDGPGEIGQVSNALDNLTISQDAKRKLPPFVVIAVQNGGNDSIGSERGLEYDTLSDRYARFIDQEVLAAVQANAQVKAAYPNLRFTREASGRASLGCSSGGAAAFSMGWFRPDLFSRIIGYSTTLVAQQDPKAAESKLYPLGAWDYHSSKELIKNDATGKERQLRIFINANQNDLGSTDAESTHHNWLMANQRTAAALKAKGYHYKFVEGMGVGHCDGKVQSATLADALIWVWRGYEPSAN